jgi:hypothetical protein
MNLRVPTSARRGSLRFGVLAVRNIASIRHILSNFVAFLLQALSAKLAIRTTFEIDNSES